MNWSDEKYVKLYTRQTVTRMAWPWQANALFPLLLQQCDGAGLIETGRLERHDAISLVTRMPVEHVRVGLQALLADGTVEAVDRGLLLPNFVEAQEARKTEALKKRDQRERLRAQARVSIGPPVPWCPPVSPPVPLQPSPAQPSPAQPRTTALAFASAGAAGAVAGSATRPRGPEKPKLVAKPPPDKPPPVRAQLPHQAASDALCADFAAVVGQGKTYAWQGAKDGAALAWLLAQAPLEEVRTRWRRGLRAQGWQNISTIAQLRAKWNDLAREPSRPSAPAPPSDFSSATRKDIPF